MKVASVRERYTAGELAGSGNRGDWTFGPFIFIRVRHPARWHRQTLLSNVVNYGWLPVLPSRRDGAYREQWMLNRRWMLRWPSRRWSRWCREHGHQWMHPRGFLSVLAVEMHKRWPYYNCGWRNPAEDIERVDSA